MDLWELVKTILAPVVQAAIRAVQGLLGGGQPPGPTAQAPTPEQQARDQQRRAQELRQKRMARQAQWFDRDVERSGSDVSIAAPEPEHWFSDGDEDDADPNRPVGRNLHWLVDPDAQRVRRMVQFSPGVVDAALRTTDSPKAAFRFLLADDINLSDEELDELLRSLGHRQIVSAPRSPSPAKAPPADMPATADPAQGSREWLEAFGQGIILNVVYGVNLTTEDQVQNWRAWMKDPRRVTEAYKAVVSTASALRRANDAAHKRPGDPRLAVASYMPGGIPEFLLFRSIMGPIEAQLSNDEKDYSAEVIGPVGMKVGDRISQLIKFYRLRGEPNFIPSQYGIVHEFGHVLDNMARGYASEVVGAEVAAADLGEKTAYRESPECTNKGKNAGLCRQHPGVKPPDYSAASEEWADRFLFWVYHGMGDPATKTELGLKPQAKSQMDQWMADIMGIAYGRSLGDKAIEQHVREAFKGETTVGRVGHLAEPEKDVILREQPLPLGRTEKRFEGLQKDTLVVVLGKDRSGEYLLIVHNGTLGWIPANTVVGGDGRVLDVSGLETFDQNRFNVLTGREYDTTKEKEWLRVEAKAR